MTTQLMNETNMTAKSVSPSEEYWR